MQHKLMLLFTTLILFGLLIAPAGTAQAQVDTQDATPDCPPYDPTLSKDQGFLYSLPLECIKTYKELTRQANTRADAQDLQTMAVGGPDGFGYTYDDSVSYNWISASTNSGLTGDDEFTGPINIGFNFPFYGITQSQLYFSTNGLITFGAGSSDYGGYSSSIELNPNNFIAPFWDDLGVGSPYNAGAIYYSQGGTAPNRYFVMEWRDVELAYGSSFAFSFEAILYENGDIVAQYQSLPDSYWPTVGIEDSIGDQRLEYSGSLSASKAIRFYYPTTSIARLLVSPTLQTGGFAPIGGHKDFTITVANTGTLGADTYDLTPSSPWAVTFFASNGTTPLTDTDGDTPIDTGLVPQGISTTVIARVTTPNSAQVGDNNMATITITSSLNASKTKTIYLFTSIPANFVNVFQDEADGAMSFMIADITGTNTSKATTDNYFGYNVAVTKLANGNYLYAWDKESFNGGYAIYPWVEDIEYALLSRSGNIILPPIKLTNNIGATIRTRDRFPSIAMAPNGTIGVVWSRYLNDFSTGQVNYNIYFATLDSSGNLLTGPTNITNNTIWGTSSDLNIPRFLSPTIAASDDNRFVIGWNEYRKSNNGYEYDIWYAIRNTTGANVFSPHALGANASYEPVLNSLIGGKVILTWSVTYDGGPYYAVINSDGTISKPATCLGPCTYSIYSSPDAVQLPNGKIAVAWPTSTGVRFSILNSSYVVESGASASTPYPTGGDVLSMTTDASSHVIMTWATGSDYNHLYYALGDSAGTFITSPMLYKTSGNYIDSSWNGQGNAAYSVYSFNDVPNEHWAQDFIERLYSAGITGGCGVNPLMYCPETTVTRAQMAVFLERGIHGSAYSPPQVGASTGFGDVPIDYWSAAWIKQLAAEGITSGCGGSSYCPEHPVTRAQMAVFLLRSKYGAGYTPPAVGASTGFGDVPTTYWSAAWIKQLVTEGITAGCSTGNYCPESPVTRAQMAVFLVRTFNLP